ncbi:MAG: hypothetical protein ABJC63_06475 [Gemmatimonadales bacterium]
MVSLDTERAGKDGELNPPRQSDSLAVSAPQRSVIMPPPPPPFQRSEEISVVGFVNVILRNRVLIVSLTLLFGFYNGYKSVTSGKSYSVESQFLVKGSRSGGQLGGLAARLGIDIGGGDASSSPQFYLDLLESKVILWPIAQKTYAVKSDSGVVTGDLIKIFRIKDPRPIVRRAKVIDALKGAISETSSQKTGVITVVVNSGNPDLAVQISTNLLAEINVYNLARRQEQAAGEREFVQSQMDEKRADLRQAEGNLRDFLERNRLFTQSPELILERQRLLSEVNMRNTLYSTMLQAYESARIEEVRNLSVISVIEPPEVPIQPNARGGVKKTLTGLLIGFVLGLVVAFLRDKLAQNKEAQTDDFVEFSQLRKEAIGDLTHPWRPISRLFRPRPDA